MNSQYPPKCCDEFKFNRDLKIRRHMINYVNLKQQKQFYLANFLKLRGH